MLYCARSRPDRRAGQDHGGRAVIADQRLADRRDGGEQAARRGAACVARLHARAGVAGRCGGDQAPAMRRAPHLPAPVLSGGFGGRVNRSQPCSTRPTASQSNSSGCVGGSAFIIAAYEQSSLDLFRGIPGHPAHRRSRRLHLLICGPALLSSGRSRDRSWLILHPQFGTFRSTPSGASFAPRCGHAASNSLRKGSASFAYCASRQRLRAAAVAFGMYRLGHSPEPMFAASQWLSFVGKRSSGSPTSGR
jgi:hypothetical protein